MSKTRKDFRDECEEKCVPYWNEYWKVRRTYEDIRDSEYLLHKAAYAAAQERLEHAYRTKLKAHEEAYADACKHRELHYFATIQPLLDARDVAIAALNARETAARKKARKKIVTTKTNKETKKEKP